MYEGTTRQKRPRDFLNYSLFWRVLDVVEVFVVLDFLAPSSPVRAKSTSVSGCGPLSSGNASAWGMLHLSVVYRSLAYLGASLLPIVSCLSIIADSTGSSPLAENPRSNHAGSPAA